jgi:hypothetical protein
MKTSTESRGRDLGVDPTARTVDREGTAEPGVESLVAAGELARMSAQDALTAGVYLLVVLVGVMSQLIGGRAEIVRLALLVPVIACFVVSLVLVIRSRVMLARALGELRRRTGAPLYPFTPWTSYASGAPLTSVAFERELRQLVSAAGRCCALAGQAEAWAAATGLLFVFWTLIGIPAR